MNDTDLTARLPKNRHDVERAAALVALGYPALAPVLPQLFQWLDSGGSDVELVVRPFFAQLGAPARDLADSALRASGKPALKYCLLRHVLPDWPRDVVATLPLDALLQAYGFHGLDIWALKLMVAKKIPTHGGFEGLTQWKNLKRAMLKEQLRVLDSLPDL